MILVTGATGLVGGHLIWHLLQENEKIIAIKRKTSKVEALRTIFSFYTADIDYYFEKIEWRTADVIDFDSLNIAFENVNIVYHCAAVVSLSNTGKSITDTNVIGTQNIVEICLKKNIDKLCFVSSIAACGRNLNGKLVDENSSWTENENRSAYATSKYNSEQIVWNGIGAGLQAVIVNPGVILGVSGTDTGSSQLFLQVRKGLLFYTNGGSGYVDVQDVVKCMIYLTKNEINGKRFIITTQNCSNKEILTWMADGFNKTRPFILIGKKLLYLVGYFAEKIASITNSKAVIDRSMARSATNREYYSNSKILAETQLKFKPIENCIQEVCKFMNNKND